MAALGAGPRVGHSISGRSEGRRPLALTGQGPAARGKHKPPCGRLPVLPSCTDLSGRGQGCQHHVGHRPSRCLGAWAVGPGHRGGRGRTQQHELYCSQGTGSREEPQGDHFTQGTPTANQDAPGPGDETEPVSSPWCGRPSGTMARLVWGVPMQTERQNLPDGPSDLLPVPTGVRQSHSRNRRPGHCGGDPAHCPPGLQGQKQSWVQVHLNSAHSEGPLPLPLHSVPDLGLFLNSKTTINLQFNSMRN